MRPPLFRRGGAAVIGQRLRSSGGLASVPSANAAQQEALPATASSTDSVAGSVLQVSASRMEEFLLAELSNMGKGRYTTITLVDILQHRSKEDLGRLAAMIQAEVPLRFATRVQQIKDTTPEWQEIPELVELHDMILLSFRRLRLVELGEGHLEAFTEVVEDVLSRHMQALVPCVARAAKALKELKVLNHAQLQDWVYKFMNSRKGSNMLLRHYQALLRDADVNHIGIVDMRCCPAQVCRRAIDFVKQHCAMPELDIRLQVTNNDMEFSFIMSILFNMVVEVLLNGIRATEVAAATRPGAPPPILVSVTASPKQVIIQISDMGGGIPYTMSERVWEYLFSTAPADPDGTRQLPTPEEWGNVTYRGMGLPLCRLYAQYLGGSFCLMSMPGVGTDAYIFLNRIDAGRVPGCFASIEGV